MAKAERRFRYTERSKDDVKERANMRGGGFDSIIKPNFKRYKMRDGKNIVRVLPPTWEEARHYGYDIWVNYSIGADNQSYLSLSKMKNERDPLEEARKQANRQGDDELAKQLQPRQRVLMWVIDRQAEDEGPQLFDAPFTVDKALANISLDEDTKEVTFIDDPENGCDFRFYKEGTGLKTDYDASKMKLLKPSPLSDDQTTADEWLSYIEENPVPDCLQFYDYDHISSVFDGKGPAKPNEDDEPTPRKAARKPKPVEDEEVDEDGVITPKRSARAKVPEPEDDDDGVKRTVRANKKPVVEEDEGAEEEVDEPAPKRESITDRLKRRRAAARDPDEDED